MIKKIFAHFWEHRAQFIRYFITGSSGFVIDMTTLVLLKEVFGFSPLLSVIINQALAINYIFFLNKFWTFKSKGQTQKQMLRFWLLMGWNYLFAVVIMYFGNSVLGFNYILVRIASIMVVVTWNFLLYKHWVYNEGGAGLKKLLLSIKNHF